jgi:hypothetical protein
LEGNIIYDSKVPATERRRPLVAATIASSRALLILAPLALARVAKNTIDPLATLADRGRLVIATGPIACSQRGERVFLRVTVTQRTTGAVAEGHGSIVCTGNDQQWQVHAATQGKASFDEGPTLAVAIARSADRGKITDAHQWLVEVTLVGE